MRAGGELAIGVVPGGEYGAQGPASPALAPPGQRRPVAPEKKNNCEPEAKENNLSGGNHGGERTAGLHIHPDFLSLSLWPEPWRNPG